MGNLYSFLCFTMNLKLPKGNQFWIFIGRTDEEAETSILWPPDSKNWLTGKDPDAEKDWRQEEKGTTEEETVGWHHQLNGHEFEQVLGVGDGQGSRMCCSPWGRKELDTTEWLNWTELKTATPTFIYICMARQVVLRYWIRRRFDPWAGKTPLVGEWQQRQRC